MPATHIQAAVVYAEFHTPVEGFLEARRWGQRSSRARWRPGIGRKWEVRPSSNSDDDNSRFMQSSFNWRRRHYLNQNWNEWKSYLLQWLGSVCAFQQGKPFVDDNHFDSITLQIFFRQENAWVEVSQLSYHWFVVVLVKVPYLATVEDGVSWPAVQYSASRQR